jgi:hypothetical protein
MSSNAWDASQWICMRAFWLAKAGNTPAEYEDAFWPRDGRLHESGAARLAIADGATETSFSGAWARLLVASYGRGFLYDSNFDAELRRIRRIWARFVGRKPLPWYAEEKLRSGAFSSLLGLTVLPAEAPGGSTGDWHATAVGDSCLLQLRDDELICSFPLTRADQFNSRPLLISSLEGDDRAELGAGRSSGRWQAGDAFFLMTDALASWALCGVEAGDDVLRRLSSVEAQADFESLVTVERSTCDGDGAPRLKNDDVTFVRCSMPTVMPS